MAHGGSSSESTNGRTAENSKGRIEMNCSRSSLSICMLSSVVLLAVSCAQDADNADAPSAEGSDPPDTIEVVVTDTLGVLMGDSSEVFGTITQASYGIDGNIYVLDGQLARLGAYTPDLRLVRYVGRSGSGPGEFQYPQSFAFLRDGRLAVCDWGAGSVVFFDVSFNYIDHLTGYYPDSPRYVVPGPGNTYIAMNMSLEQDEDGIRGSSFIARFSEGIDHQHVYDSWPLMITAYGDTDDPDLSIGRVDHDFDTDALGILYLAERDDSTYMVESFFPDGTVDTLVLKDWQRVEKTREQLEQQLYEETRQEGQGGGQMDRRTIRDIFPYHNAISSVDVDVSGNVWVGQGYTDTPTFEVYSPSGDLQYVAVIPELTGTRGVEYCFRNGYLAYDRQPEDYPKVYLLQVDLPDQSQ
jgi:hypothetical protein